MAAGGHYTGKPRPALVVQSDLFLDLESVALCLLSSDLVQAPLLRLTLEPSPDNGLAQTCQVMVDKLVTVPRGNVGSRTGTVDDETLVRVDRSLALFLGIAQ